jgi:outer membrane protein OmpA-like peptidoglycan-associated protein
MPTQRKMPNTTQKIDRVRRLALIGVLAVAASLAAGCASQRLGLTPEQIAALKAQGFVEMAQGWTLDQSTTVLFAVNDATLSDAGARKIALIGKSLQAVRIMRLKVVGYTDSIGDDEYNEALSKRRADAVVAALADGGFSRAGLESIGMGKRHPIADNRTEAGRAQNRHVSIIVVVD